MPLPGRTSRCICIAMRYSNLAIVAVVAAGCASHGPRLPAPIPPVSGEPRVAFSLRYIDVAVGAGAPAEAAKCLYVHYTGWLTDGTKFDSSHDTTTGGTPRTPIAFPQGFRRVIAGWDAGFEGMRVGGHRRLLIPYQLAYGERGRPPVIPPRATLIFDTELMAVADTLAVARAPSAPAPQCASWATVGGPSVQYRSPTGVEYRAQPDTGAIARAEAALAADPRTVARYLEVGLAQSGARQFREAIRTYTRGLAVAPDEPLLYRWRGHRFLSVRELDRALDDLTRGFHLDSADYGILYHLGVTRFALGDFAGAADAFASSQRLAPNAGELAGSTDWLWMALSRAGRRDEARAMLDRRPDSLSVDNAYARRLRLYRGEIGPDQVMTPADTADVQVATLAFGIGNWYLLRGDTTQAQAWFERAVQSGGWPAFGFIVAEIELRRLR